MAQLPGSSHRFSDSRLGQLSSWQAYRAKAYILSCSSSIDLDLARRTIVVKLVGPEESMRSAFNRIGLGKVRRLPHPQVNFAEFSSDLHEGSQIQCLESFVH